jgi:hypothetical protein
MLPAAYHLELYRGDTFVRKFKLWADPGKTQPVDLTDVAVKSEIRDKSAGVLIVPLTCDVVQPPTLGEIDVSLDMTLWPTVPAIGFWDLQLTNLNGVVWTAVAGKVNVTGDITDSVAVGMGVKRRP